MLAPWVVDEMKTANLKDRRLNARLREVLSQLSAHPTANIPAACGGRAETEAAAGYRSVGRAFASDAHGHGENERGVPHSGNFRN